jgi:Flp pilus assembly protein TadG
MKSRIAKRGSKGQAQVEFALTVVFVMLLILASLEMIVLIYTYSVLADAAKEGVRYAIVHGADVSGGSGPTCPCAAIDGAAGTGVVKTYAQYSLHDTSNMAVTVDYNPGGNNGAQACNKPPCLVRVTVSYPYQPFFGLGWPTVTLNAAAEGRVVF